MQDVVAQDRAADGLHIGPNTHKAISKFFKGYQSHIPESRKNERDWKIVK